MKKIGWIIIVVTCMVMLNSCDQNKNDSFINSANYNSPQHTLFVNFTANPDTSLLQIIEYSEIRKSGYGLLLNVENTYLKSELDALKLKLQKLDINAIHSYNISLTDTLESKVSIAMEGAKFVWLLKKKNSEWESTPLGDAINNLQKNTEKKVLIVLD